MKKIIALVLSMLLLSSCASMKAVVIPDYHAKRTIGMGKHKECKYDLWTRPMWAKFADKDTGNCRILIFTQDTSCEVHSQEKIIEGGKAWGGSYQGRDVSFSCFPYMTKKQLEEAW